MWERRFLFLRIGRMKFHGKDFGRSVTVICNDAGNKHVLAASTHLTM